METLSFEAALAFGRFSLDASFEVSAGEILVLVGPNGAGKSTCLHLAAGLLRPERARITLGGRILCDTEAGVDVAPERRRVGMLFQDYALFPHRDVAWNVRYGARTEELARSWMERLGIADLARERIDHLSGGQRQRVALARTLAAEPAALLLDEPLSALDVSTRATVRAELRAFLESVSLPTVLVTHDAVDAFALGRRIVVLEEGRVLQTGTHEDLARHPRNAFVAELAGRNVVRVVLEGDGAGGELRVARSGTLVFHVLGALPPGEAFLSFAPSDVVLSAEPARSSAQNTFPVTVRDVLPLPDRARVVLDAGVIVLADVTREAVHALGIAPGRSLWAAVKATGIHVYR